MQPHSLLSAEAQQQRRESLPTPNFNPLLPVTALREEIAHAIQTHQVIILAGETGSGKTTQLPQICLSLGRGVAGYIGHTQPRRIAARSVAHRLAEELKVVLGQQVGYKVRFQDQVTPNSIIKVMTDGVLLAEIQQDRYLKRYDTLIIDEAHERSLNIDFLLGYLKQLLPKRPDLKIIITSATLDHQRFAEFFHHAPVIEVPGKTYPVEVIYRPRERLIFLEDNSTEKTETDIPHAVLDAVQEIILLDRRQSASRPRDILVFFSGENEIRETSQVLRRATLIEPIDILPLYARLPPKEQQKVFQSSAQRRIILTTNVAETSLTVPNIGYVIDTGYARISQYSVQSKIQRLPILPISKASANQRKGRCGRIAPGLCIRLYSENDFNLRAEYTLPELLRSNLAAVILRMAALSLGHVEQFPFVDVPDQRLINDGYRLLQDLGAMNQERKLTSTGREMIYFPVDPRLSRLLVAAHHQHCLQEMLIIVSALSGQNNLLHGNNPEHNPLKNLSLAPHPTSQLMDFILFWQTVETQHQNLTRKQFSHWCDKKHLPERSLREWRELHCQLSQICETLKWRINQQATDQATLHKALLTGLLDQIGQRKENREYLLARQRHLLLPKNTPWQKNLPSWIMAAELLEVRGLIASHIAEIQPEWIEAVAGNRLKKNHQDIHWEMQRGQVMAYEQASLYGLIIYSRRKIHYGPIDKKISREIFIRSALAEQNLKTRAAFYQHNHNLIVQVEQLEDKIRRQDLLVSEQTLFEFYETKIPDSVYNQTLLEHWLAENKDHEKCLYLSEADLLQRSTDHIQEKDFPNTWPFAHEELLLDYHFEPGHDSDGVTLTIPLEKLEQIQQSQLDWLVQGLLAKKCEALLRGLPKAKRRAIVPIPDYVQAFLQAQPFGEGILTERLTHHIQRMTGVMIQAEDWSLDQLESCYQMNLRIIENKKILAEGRSLSALKKQLHQKEIIAYTSKEQAQQIAHQDQRQRHWQELEKTRRYLLKSYKSSLEKFILYFPFWLSIESLFEEIFLAAIQWEIIDKNLPADSPIVIQCSNSIVELLNETKNRFALLRETLKQQTAVSLKITLADIQQQMDELIKPGFLLKTPKKYFERLPNYLTAIDTRLKRLAGNVARDQQSISAWQKLNQQIEQKKARMESPELSPQLIEIRWQLEEYRLVLFAQPQKTLMPVSEQRILKLLAEIPLTQH